MNYKLRRKSIREQIAEMVESGRVKMRPRWQFVLRAALAGTGALLLLAALLYIASFIIFALHLTGAWFIPIFGWRGLRAFLASLPWLLFSAAVVFVVILEWLVKRYSFAYRRPLLYSVFGILILTAVGGFMIARTPFHGGLFRQAETDRLPVGGSFYRRFGMERLRDVHRGTVTEITDDGFRMLNRRGETLTVTVAPATRFPLGMDFREGDMVVVFGGRDDHTVSAAGIRKVDDEFNENFHLPMMPRDFHTPRFKAVE